METAVLNLKGLLVWNSLFIILSEVISTNIQNSIPLALISSHFSIFCAFSQKIKIVIM